MSAAFGITGYGAYVPRLRLQRAAVAAAHAWMGSSLKALGKGERAFCSWDEDAVTMAVEAARDGLADRDRSEVRQLRLSSTTLPYADLSPGVIAASALGLPAGVQVLNEAGSQRAGTTSLLQALTTEAEGALVVASERPQAKPGGAAEIGAGAGAAAFLLGSGEPVAVLRGSATRAAHFVDHFRAADAAFDYTWEERWIRDEGYGKLVPAVAKEALAAAGVAASDIAYFCMPSPMRGVAAGLAKQLGITGEVNATLDAGIGWCGAAHGLLMLADVLERAQPGERILLIGFGQGVDALVLETTEALAASRPRRGLAAAIADGRSTADYLRYLSFYDGIQLEWGMRGEKTGKAALTEHHRVADQLDAFTGGECRHCGTVQFPRLAYCVNPQCKAPGDELEPVSLADEPARIFTITADWLSYHPAPPLCVGFVQFENGARLLMEVVDGDPDTLDVGAPLRMVFRIKERDAARGYNRYFWKATPIAA